MDHAEDVDVGEGDVPVDEEGFLLEYSGQEFQDLLGLVLKEIEVLFDLGDFLVVLAAENGG